MLRIFNTRTAGRSRRSALFFALVTLIALALTTPSPTRAQTTTPSRIEINKMTPGQLQAFRDAVAVMKSRNRLGRDMSTRDTVAFRHSWTYWANMHGHWGRGCHEETIPAGTLGVSHMRPMDQVFSSEISTWCKCAHTNDNENETSIFLPWHRIYVWMFERVLRAAAVEAATTLNRPTDPDYLNLTVPYWDINTSGYLPAALRSPTYVHLYTGQTLANPLYASSRRTEINAGTLQISQGVRNSSAAALAETNYADFTRSFESQPHGGVHCGVSTGGRCSASGLMGQPASAANDPVFWLHHSNVDRLYQCWLDSNGGAAALPSDAAFLDHRFPMVGITGQVNIIRLGNRMTLQQLGYNYMPADHCASAAPAPVRVIQASAAAPAPTARSTATSQMTLSAPQSMVDPAAQKASVTVPAQANQPKRRVRLLAIDVQPDALGRLVDVFLETSDKRRVNVGTMSFFGVDANAQHHHGGPTKSFNYDVTAAIKALGVKPGDKLTVILEPVIEGDDLKKADKGPGAPDYGRVELIVK